MVKIAARIADAPASGRHRRSSRSEPHRNKTSAGARIAASGPVVKSGATRGAIARLRSRRHSSSLSRFSPRLRHSVRSSAARRLQADPKVSNHNSVRSRRLGRQSRRDAPTSGVVRRRVVRKVSQSSSAKSHRNATNVAMTMDGAVAALIRHGPSSRINPAIAAMPDLIVVARTAIDLGNSRGSAMGARMAAHRKGRLASVVATDLEKAVGSVRHAAVRSVSMR